MSEIPQPTPEDAKIGDHPISSFNLNAHGENPDFESEKAPDLMPSPELTAELQDMQTVEDPESGQNLGMLELNREAGGTPVVSLFEYSVDGSHRGANHQLEQIALQSGRRIIALENPSTGESDKLMPEQKQGLKEGDFEPIARSMLGALQTKGIDRIDLEGHSLAGRIASALAAHAHEFGITVDKLVIMEPAGFDQASFKDLVTRLMLKEGASMQEYSKLVQDPRGKEAMDTPVIKNYAKMIKKDARGNIIAYPRALGSGTLEPDLVTALETQPGLKLDIISGGASQISLRDSVNEAYNNLHEAYGDRVHMVRLPGDTHMLNIGQARRVGWHIGRLLK